MAEHAAEYQPAALVPPASPILDIAIARARARAADDAGSRAYDALQLACKNLEDALQELRAAAAGPEQGGGQ